MRKARPVPSLGVLARAWDSFHGSGASHDEEVEHIADPGPAEVRVAKTHDRTVRIVISRAPVPPLIEGIGTQLNHSERDCSSWVAVPVATSTDLRLDKLRDVARLVPGCCTCPLRSRGLGAEMAPAKTQSRGSIGGKFSSGNHSVAPRFLVIELPVIEFHCPFELQERRSKVAGRLKDDRIYLKTETPLNGNPACNRARRAISCHPTKLVAGHTRIRSTKIDMVEFVDADLAKDVEVFGDSVDPTVSVWFIDTEALACTLGARKLR